MISPDEVTRPVLDDDEHDLHAFVLELGRELMGVEEPKCLIHAPNESVDPSEIENLALSEALFLEKYATAPR